MNTRTADEPLLSPVDIARSNHMADHPEDFPPDDLGEMIRRLRAVAVAAEGVAYRCLDALNDVATTFSCREAELIANLIGTVAGDTAAEQFRWFHASDDTEDSGDHQAHIDLRSGNFPDGYIRKAQP